MNDLLILPNVFFKFYLSSVNLRKRRKKHPFQDTDSAGRVRVKSMRIWHHYFEGCHDTR